MKRIKYFIFTLLAASTIFVSCDLDRNPLDKFAENDFWTSEDNAELALTGVYKGNILFNSPEYTPTDWWSYGGLIFMEFPTDKAGFCREASHDSRITQVTNTFQKTVTTGYLRIRIFPISFRISIV